VQLEEFHTISTFIPFLVTPWVSEKAKQFMFPVKWWDSYIFPVFSIMILPELVRNVSKMEEGVEWITGAKTKLFWGLFAIPMNGDLKSSFCFWWLDSKFLKLGLCPHGKKSLPWTRRIWYEKSMIIIFHSRRQFPSGIPFVWKSLLNVQKTKSHFWTLVTTLKSQFQFQINPKSKHSHWLNNELFHRGIPT
jgi:hypothetical protein